MGFSNGDHQEEKDGTVRLCVDYRKLNSETEMDAYPMPRVDDILDQVGITTLDLAKGYWQVPIAEEDHNKMAFVTTKGLYQFNIRALWSMMDEVIWGMNQFTGAYLDDLIMFSATWHMAHVRAVLNRLSKVRLTTKPKCQLAMEECTCNW